MREVLPLAAAPDAAALTRAGTALKLHAIKGVRRLVLVDVRSHRNCPKRLVWKRALASHAARSAGSRRTTLHPLLFAPDNSDSMVALNSAMMTMAS